jgi:sugar phosphate isomerase/epimerase
MSFSRRQLLAGIAAGGMSTRPGWAQTRPGDGPRQRSAPSVCLYSQVLIKVGYDELGPILKSLGADGCDLTVMPGGHVDPQNAGLHLMRAIEAITGVGLDVPVLSTAYTSLADQTLNIVAGVAHEMGIPLLRAGHWKYAAEGGIETRLAEVQRDINGLAALARAAQMTVVLRNVAGEVGGALWDTHMLIRGLDPRMIGYDYDAGNAMAAGGTGWETALELVLGRIRMVTARDFSWSKDADGVWKAVPCAPGEGMVNWRKLFQSLARVRFTGPISVPLDYQPKDELGAIRRDIEFLKKQVAAAYG